MSGGRDNQRYVTYHKQGTSTWGWQLFSMYEAGSMLQRQKKSGTCCGDLMQKKPFQIVTMVVD